MLVDRLLASAQRPFPVQLDDRGVSLEENHQITLWGGEWGLRPATFRMAEFVPDETDPGALRRIRLINVIADNNEGWLELSPNTFRDGCATFTPAAA